MTVVFRPLRWGHAVEAREIATGETDEIQLANFVFTLVASWDYLDIETGEPIPLDQPRLLSLEQFNDLMAAFKRRMEGGGSVNPQNGVNSSSGLTPSKPAKRNSRKLQLG